MFEHLTGRLESVFKTLKGQGKLSENNIQSALREVRRALLEADVNYKVAREFVGRIGERAVGQEVMRSLTPGQQVIKIVHQELTHLMGDRNTTIEWSGSPPTVVMLVGLQGSGKTTAAAKLAVHCRSKARRPMLVAADVYRPAAIDQLEILGRSIEVPVHRGEDGADPVDICLDAFSAAQWTGYDPLILDTAGRLHIDDEMMTELERIKGKVQPHEILFVADGMTGQDAVNAAKEFLDRLDFTGVILTKMDGDARGGAALSIRSVTERPIKFIGVGEKVDALEPFFPDRMASRILGMGDVLSLVEKAEQAIDEEKAKELEQKIRKETFTLEDFVDQLDQVKKMGPLDQLLGMIPGMGKSLKGVQVDDNAFVRIEAIINSMTPDERRRPNIIDGSRRRRIARGSGTTVQDVNLLMKQFSMMRRMMRNLGKTPPGRRPRGMRLF